MMYCLSVSPGSATGAFIAHPPLHSQTAIGPNSFTKGLIRMKVLKLTPFFHHPDANSWPVAYDSVGGMQVQTWRQAVWLAQEGIQQHVMTIGFPGLPKLRQLHPFLWVERMLLPMPQIRSEFSGLIGLTQSWAVATLSALLKKDISMISMSSIRTSTGKFRRCWSLV